MKRGERWVTCDHCEGSFSTRQMLGGQLLPRHRAFRGEGSCPGSLTDQYDPKVPAQQQQESPQPKKNPPLAVFGNPPRPLSARMFRVQTGKIVGEIGEVYAIVYRHSETNELMVHGFGPDGDDIDLKSLPDGVQVRRMNVNGPTGTFAYAMQEGGGGRRTIRLSHVDGEPLWDDR